MWPFPYGEPVAVIRAGEIEDPYSGETELDWDNPTEIPYEHCGVDSRSVGENEEPLDLPHRRPVIDGLTIYGPPDMDVTAHDRMRVRGKVWQVHGDPEKPRSPFTGWEPGTTVRLRKVDG